MVYYGFIGLGVLSAEIAKNPIPAKIHLDPITLVNDLPALAPPVIGALAVKALLDSKGLLSDRVTAAGVVVCFQNGVSWRAAAASVGH